GLLVVAQQIVPIRYPILSVALIIGQQPIDKSLAFVQVLVVQEALQMFRCWRQSYYVEEDPPGKCTIIDSGRRLDFMFRPVGLHKAIDARAFPRRRRWRQLQRSEFGTLARPPFAPRIVVRGSRAMPVRNSDTGIPNHDQANDWLYLHGDPARS